jgi:hypothetical protein
MNIPALRLSRRPIPWLPGVVASAAVVACGIAGCDEPPPDRTAVRLAERVTHEQAAQNKRLADATKSLAQGSQQLVAAEAKARQEVIALQRDLRQDQADIGRQRDSLEAERRRIATQRLTDSTWSATLLAVGILLACLAPLVLAGITLVGLWRAPSAEELHDVLVEHFTHNSPVPATVSGLPPTASACSCRSCAVANFPRARVCLRPAGQRCEAFFRWKIGVVVIWQP